MFKKISVLVPTRGRVERLRRMMDSFTFTTSACAELVFRIDEDDLESQAFFHLTDWKVFVGPRHEGYRSTPQFLIDMLPLADGDVVMVGNDDMVFETSCWDNLVLGEANRYPDGLFNIGVQTLNTDHFPFSIVSRRVVDTLGFMYDPRIFWGDIYLRDIMIHFGRAIILNSVRIAHEWVGNNPDRVFLEANHEKLTIGTPEYWQRHREVVNEAIQKLASVGVAI